MILPATARTGTHSALAYTAAGPNWSRHPDREGLDQIVELLNPIEVRVLGALIEKAATTPDYYPLSLNALTAATNQTSNRDPVVDYDEPTVAAALETLRVHGLVNVVHRGDARIERYRHVAHDRWELQAAAIAVMAVLMLRGPQTVGEIRARTQRLHEFTDIDAVQTELDALVARTPDPLVRRLERRPGQKEVRYVHLLSGDEEVGETGPGDSAGDDDGRLTRLEDEVEGLRSEVDDLRRQFDAFRREFQ